MLTNMLLSVLEKIPNIDPETNQQYRSLLSNLSYLDESGRGLVDKAYSLSAYAHTKQERVSGEPYVRHPLAVAYICANWHLDAEVVSVALLHDVLEDNKDISYENIEEVFGESVAKMVEGLSKVDKLEQPVPFARQTASIHKMLLAATRDLRIILVKLADRLHNMQTLGSLNPKKRQRTAQETLDIYAPIALRLGMHAVYRELQDLSFMGLYPLRHAILNRAMQRADAPYRLVAKQIREYLQSVLSSSTATQLVTVEIQEKHVYTVYQDMRKKKTSFLKSRDTVSLKLLVDTVAECYSLLGIMHSLYQPIPGRFKDHIAIPKHNGYQALHTRLISPDQVVIRLLICTRQMNEVAEMGIVSHWLGKTDTDESSTAEKNQSPQLHVAHSLFDVLKKLKENTANPVDFIHHLQADLFPDLIYVSTPRGEMLTLPRGSTPVDFAYTIHTEIGNTCARSYINGELKPLQTPLRTGDIIRIETLPGSSPDPQWLTFIRTPLARTYIERHISAKANAKAVALGEELLDSVLRQMGKEPSAQNLPRWEHLCHITGSKSREHLLKEIGLGKRLAGVVAHQLLHALPKQEGLPQQAHHSPVIALNKDNRHAIHIADCCQPIPPDTIMGHIDPIQGLDIHRKSCPIFTKGSKANPDKWIDIAWDTRGTINSEEENVLYLATIRAVVVNTVGILAKILSVIAQTNINTAHVDVRNGDSSHHSSLILFSVQVKNNDQLNQLISTIESLPDCLEASRLEAMSMPISIDHIQPSSHLRSH